jgi:hypothetical protein
VFTTIAFNIMGAVHTMSVVVQREARSVGTTSVVTILKVKPQVMM